MLHHVSIGARDVEKAVAFYDSVLGALGMRRIMEYMPYAVGYGAEHPEFWVQAPADGQPATAGNGTHICFAARTREAIQAFHAAALAAGGRDEGAPGPRPDYGPDYFGAFARDLDGNKIEAALIGPDQPEKRKSASAKKTKAKSAGTKKTAAAKKRTGKAAPKSARTGKAAARKATAKKAPARKAAKAAARRGAKPARKGAKRR